MSSDSPRSAQRLSPHLRGHLFQFDPRPAGTHGAPAGSRLLLTALGLEVMRIAAVTFLGPAVPLWLLMPLLLGLALCAVPVLTGLRLSSIGFHRWRDWTTTEKSYFLQVVVLANLVFPLVLAAPLRERIAESGIASVLSGVFLPYLAFGFYQELVYRGLVQLELCRRWSASVGVLVANMLYTFGALHWNYYSSPLPVAVLVFASVFAIGLCFGLLFRRTGNLWIVAVFHAIGNAYIIASLEPVQSGSG